MKHKSPDFRCFVEERMMGLEPTTFCMARGSGGDQGTSRMGQTLMIPRFLRLAVPCLMLHDGPKR
jgi:hypothetical protein